MMRLYLALGGLLTLLAAVWLYGNARYDAGQKDLIKEIEKARTASIEEKKEIEDEIDQLTNDELLRRALGYVRAGGR